MISRAAFVRTAAARERAKSHVHVRKAYGIHVKMRHVKLPRQQQPNAIRLAYSIALRSIVAEALVTLKKVLYPHLESLVLEASLIHDARRTYADKVQEMVDRAGEELFHKFGNERIRAIATKYGDRASKFQKEQLRKQVQRAFASDLGLDVVAEKGIEDRIAAWASVNIKLIKSVPQGFYSDVSQRVVTALRKGTRASDLQSMIQDRYGVTESRARTIARDQIGKLNGELNKARQRNMGVERFVWRTSEDERVRPEHEDLDGKTFKWNDPPSEGIPGEPINCRCEAEPVLSDILDDL